MTGLDVPQLRAALALAEEAIRRSDDDPDLVTAAQHALQALPHTDTIGVVADDEGENTARDGGPPPATVAQLLAARATLRWRLVSASLRGYDGGAEEPLARAIAEQDAAQIADRELTRWTSRTGLDPEPDHRASLDRARRGALRAIAALPGLSEPTPPVPEQPGSPVTSPPSASQFSDLMDRARTVEADFTAHGSRTSDESLVQTAMFTSARALAAKVWDPDAERLLGTVSERVEDHPDARDRMHAVLMPAAQMMLSLARVMIRRLDPLSGSPQAAGDLHHLVSRTEELIDRIEGPHAPFDPSVVPMTQLLHLLLGAMMLLVRGDEPGVEAGPVLRDRAEQHLEKAPAGMRDVVDELLLADRWRQGSHVGARPHPGDGPPADDPEANSARAQDADEVDARIRAKHPEMSEELGAGLPGVLRLVEQAQRTRLLPDIDRALDRSREVQAGLPHPHPLHGHLLAVTAHLRALRASVTHEGADTAAAVQAGAHAVVHAVREAAPPDLESIHPLTEALLMCALADSRGGGHGEAETALSAALERPDLDERARLSACVGLGVARALRWAGGADEGLRHSAREALNAAREQLLVTSASLESMQIGVGLLQFEMVMAAMWGDPQAPEALGRVADHLEPLLQAHPDLRARLDVLVGSLTAPPGMADLTAGGGVLGLIRAVRQMSGMLATVTALRSSGPMAPFLQDALPDADTAGGLLAAALHAAQQGTGGSMVTDPMAMMQAVQAVLAGSGADFRQHYAAATGSPPAPNRPPAAAADRVLTEAMARLRDLLGEGAHIGPQAPERRPLERAGRPEPDTLRAATSILSTARAAGVDPVHDHEAGDLLGVGLAELYWAGAAGPDVLAQALRLLERARQHEAEPLPTLRLVDRWDVQACCYAELGRTSDRQGALDDALGATRAALRELGRLVLLAGDTDSALSLAARADRLVTRAIEWCLAQGRGGDAVAIAEAGRGLVLAAATVSGRVGQMLNALGRDDVAAAWRRGDAAGLASGLAAVSAEPEGIALLRVPSAQDVAMAVHATGLDAIVYLVPPGRIDPQPPGAPPRAVTCGHALVVTPGFTVEVVELPGVQNTALPEVARYVDAFHRALEMLDSSQELPYGFRGSPAGGEWVEAIDALGAWAYTCVMRPLLAHLGIPTAGPVPQRPRRVALIPLGGLGAIPFAAAWTEDLLVPGRRRYAIHDLVLSQAASGRLLGEVARRRALPIARRPVFLIDPTGEFSYGQLAGEAIVEHLYPHAQLLGLIGKDGPADADSILSALPRRTGKAADRSEPEPERQIGPQTGPASVLHLITHAVLPSDQSADLLTGTRLQVRREQHPGGQGSALVTVGQDESAWLSLGRILDQARGADPDQPSGLVICDACVTDVAVSHRDESLSLATAFLAAGATGAIGTRWPVDDDTAGVLTYLLHHFLQAGARPAEALRSAQLWMLDQRRQPVPGLPPALAHERTAGRWAEPASWAAYVHHGT